MKDDSPNAASIPTTIHRFARLPQHRRVAELAQQVWETPTFAAKEFDGTTQFIFTVPIQAAFKRQDPTIHRILFEAKTTKWTSAIEKAYPETRSGKKLIKEFIDTLLYKVFYEALLVLNTDTEGLAGDYTKFKQEFTGNFRAASPRTPGKRPIPNRAQLEERLARRYEALLPQLRELRTFVDRLTHSGMTDSLLGMKVTAAFKGDWVSFAASGSAFERLPGALSRSVSEIATTLGGKWAPWQATVGVIRCEEAKRNPKNPLSVVSIYKMIMAGKKPPPKPQNDH
jgi:hypothetical protein